MILRIVEKARYAIFSAGESTVCLLACGSPGGKRRKEALLCKASEPTAHVAGLGIKVGGLRPSDTSQGFIDS